MVLPTSLPGVFALFALFVPGLVWASVRTLLQGYKTPDRVAGERLAQAVFVSALLDPFYLLVFGWWLAPIVSSGTRLLTDRPWEAGLVVLVFGVAIPAAVAYVAYAEALILESARKLLNGRGPKWLTKFRPATGLSSVPTAWDWAARRKGGNWIRVLTQQGKWIGGWFADESFFSTFPEPRDLFLAEPWALDAEGVLQHPVPESAGIWLSLEGAQLDEWTKPVDAEAASAEEAEDGRPANW